MHCQQKREIDEPDRLLIPKTILSLPDRQYPPAAAIVLGTAVWTAA